MRTIAKSEVNVFVIGGLLLASVACSAQIIATPNSGDTQGPDNKGRCWHEVSKGYNDLSFIQKQIYKVSCRKDKDTCNDYSMFGAKRQDAACPAPAAEKKAPTVTPVAPPPEPKPVTPAPANSKPVLSADGRHLYVCPKGSMNSPDGLPVCKMPDGSYVPLQEIPIPAGALPPVANPQAAPGKTKRVPSS